LTGGGVLAGAVSEKAKRWLPPLRIAVITADALFDTPGAETENVAEEAPAVTITDAGALKIELLLKSPTERPPDGAG
jgi:hypothetical protein